MKSLRSRIVALTALWAAAGLALLIQGCSGFGGPRTVTLDEAQIAAWVGRQFPVQRRVLELFDLEIAAPTLRLIPERNRLAGDFTITGSDRLSRRPVRGRMVLESALRFEPADASVRLVQVRVQRIELDTSASAATPLSPFAPTSPTSPAVPSTPASRATIVLAEQVLEDLAIYRIPPQRLESLRALGLSPGAVTVTSRGIELSFEPVRR